MPDPDPWNLSLSPLSLEPEAAPVQAPPASGRARFNVDLRSGKERRLLPERRGELRFSADRRSGHDRRPRRGWEPGRNL
jgi:hypothetical protein